MGTRAIMTTKNNDIYLIQLRKCLTHLEYSLNDVAHRPSAIDAMTEADLSAWESLTTRFSRLVDIFIGKYLRSKVLEKDPGFQGFVRDYLDAGEKLGLISRTDSWLGFRGVRNRIAHEYMEADLEALFKFVFNMTPELINDVKKCV